MERFLTQIQTVGKAYAGASVTFLSQVVSTRLPDHSFVQYFSNYISIVVGVLTALYTITKLWDWIEKRFIKKP